MIIALNIVYLSLIGILLWSNIEAEKKINSYKEFLKNYNNLQNSLKNFQKDIENLKKKCNNFYFVKK